MKTVGPDFRSAQDPHRNIKEIDVSIQRAALDYAAAHSPAGNLGVNINGGEFVFVFATGLENQRG